MSYESAVAAGHQAAANQQANYNNAVASNNTQAAYNYGNATQKASIQTGNVLPAQAISGYTNFTPASGYTVPPISTTIDASKIGTNKTNLSTKLPSTADFVGPNYNANVAGYAAAAGIGQPTEDTKGNNDSLSTKIQGYLDSMSAPNSNSRENLMASTGANESFQRLQSLRTQIAERTAAYQKGFGELGDQPIPMPIIGSQKNKLQAQKESEIGLLTAQMQVEQGNYEYATKLVDNIVDDQFKAATLQNQYKLKAIDMLNDERMLYLKAGIEQDTKAKEAFFDWKKDAIMQAMNAGDQKALNYLNNASSFGEVPASITSKYALTMEAKLKQAQIANQYSEINSRNIQNMPVSEISAGNPMFKVAQDLAYGKLTFSQFRTLYAYSKNSGQKLAIYNKASELNPNFDPAGFELGYKVAASPKIRQQISALDNVQAVIPKLLQESDAASRSNIPVLNKAIIAGGIAIGNKNYSNLEAARTAFADELSGALGFGSATDMSRQMGFDLTKTNLSPTQFNAAMNDIVVPFIQQKRNTLINQMGVYGQTVNNMSSNNSSDPLGLFTSNTNSTDPFGLFNK